jgi:hypothetical protein
MLTPGCLYFEAVAHTSGSNSTEWTANSTGLIAQQCPGHLLLQHATDHTDNAPAQQLLLLQSSL